MQKIAIALFLLSGFAFACGGGSSHDQNSEADTSGILTTVVENSYGNTYTVSGEEDSVEGVTVEIDTEKDTADIITDTESPLIDKFDRIDFPDTSDQKLRSQIKIKYDEIPDLIIAYDETDEEYFTLPFSVTEDGYVIIRIFNEDLSILPVKDNSTASSSKSSSVESTAKKITEDSWSFNIVENNGSDLQIRINTEEMNRAEYWSVKINDSSGSLENVPDNGVIYDQQISVSGIYTFKIYGLAARLNPLRIWTQDVFVQSADDLSGIDVSGLAEKYAPILAYNDNEEYYPARVDYILNENLEYQLPIVVDREVNVPYSKVIEFMAYNGSRDARINFSTTSETHSYFQKNRGMDASGSTVYYSMIKGDDNYFFNYHMFYTYDPKDGSSNDPGTAAHVFDRESMAIVLDSSFSPQGVIYGAHMDGQNLSLLELNEDKNYSWDGSGVFVSWGNVRKFIDRPIAFVAKGSHALYPVCGMFKVFTLTEMAGGGDDYSSDAEWNHTLVPSGLSGHLDTYTLEDLGIGNITSTSDNAYLAFSGLWVDGLLWGNAKFPPFTIREMDPEQWFADSGEWEINIDDLPQYSQDLMDDLATLLDEQTESGGSVETVFEDDFNTGLDNWNLFGSPSPQIIDTIYDRNYVFDNRGDANYSSGAYSKQAVDISTGGTIQSEVYLDYDNLSGCWASASVELSRDDNPVTSSTQAPSRGIYWVITAIGDACWATDEEYRRHAWFNFMIYAEDGETESPGSNVLSADDYVDQWINAKIIVRSDRRVEFYVNNTLMWTSTKSIDSSMLTGKRVVIGNRSSGSAGKAYHDWVSVTKTN